MPSSPGTSNSVEFSAFTKDRPRPQQASSNRISPPHNCKTCLLPKPLFPPAPKVRGGSRSRQPCLASGRHLRSGLAAGLQPSGNAALSSCTCCTLVQAREKPNLVTVGAGPRHSVVPSLRLTTTNKHLSSLQNTGLSCPGNFQNWRQSPGPQRASHLHGIKHDTGEQSLDNVELTQLGALDDSEL